MFNSTTRYLPFSLLALVISSTISAILFVPQATAQSSLDTTTFSHHMASVNGIQMHYVIGGQGDPVVLLHGWPQTWYEWPYYACVSQELHGDRTRPERTWRFIKAGKRL